MFAVCCLRLPGRVMQSSGSSNLVVREHRMTDASISAQLRSYFISVEKYDVLLPSSV